MKLYHITLHLPDCPWMASVLAETPEKAIEAARRQLRAPKGAWAHAVEVNG